MYIFFAFLFYFFFFNNFSNFFFFYFVTLFLAYFFYSQNLIFFFENYSFNEDRFIVLLENITRIEYNFLYIFIFILYLYYIFFSNINLALVLVFFFCLLNQNFFYYFQDFYAYLFFQFRLNTRLLNGLFLIHPFIVYFFYSFIIGFSFFLLYFCKFKFYFLEKYEIRFLNINLGKILFCIVFFGLFAIILGSWWAFQEINWNGWWSWDLIEIINLLLIFYILMIIHQKKLSLIKFTQNSINTALLFFFILPLFFMGISRFNLINSLHSFVLLDNFSQFYFTIKWILMVVFFFLSLARF